MHTDPEVLSLLALGEHVGSADDHSHLQTCPQCSGELSELQWVTTLGRSVDAETSLASPSPDVWARIRAELALDQPAAAPAAPVVDDIPGIRSTRKALLSPLSIVKAALGRRSRGFGHELMAHTQLRPVAASWSDASGTAELATDEHGRRLLQVALHAELPASGVRQAWLVHRDDPTQRQTLGILDGQHGLWTVEHSIDLTQYSVLDISQQGTGQTEHSGQTIVRGELALVS